MSTLIRGAASHRSVLVLIAVLALVAGACGSGASSPGGAPAAGAAGGGNGIAQGDQSVEQPQAAAPSAGPAEPGNGSEAAFKDGAKIIRTGQLQLTVGDVSKALLAARSAIQGLGGYIGASQQYQDGEDTVATITYRIPADNWEAALDALRKLGKEQGENTSSADVTGQIVDLDARIRNLKASETALVGYIDKAAKVSDILDIESRLSDVRGQIEQLTAQKAGLDDQVAYATLAVTFGVNVPAVQAAAATWDPANEADRAGATLVGFLQGLVTAGIWFGIVWLPILLVIALVLGVVVFVGRRFGFFRRSAGAPPMPPAAAEG
jgi:predicted lipid-binding transport protein (Tim44 family)